MLSSLLLSMVKVAKPVAGAGRGAGAGTEGGGGTIPEAVFITPV